MTNPDSSPHFAVTDKMVQEYERNGVVLLKGILTPSQVEELREGVAANMEHPGPYASDNEKDGETGRFFDDYCNWNRIPAFQRMIETSALAPAGRQLMQSKTVQLFHDHVLVKEGGTSMATPWHQDGPYYFVQGSQTISFWCPLDPVSDATLRCVPTSHQWEKEVLPIRWVSQEGYFPGNKDQYLPIPDPDTDDGMEVVEWAMEPGDALAFDFRTLHGARGNTSGERRRAFSLRLVGDDAYYVQRSGPTSPPFPGHDMKEGQRLREDWFPILLK